MTTNYTVPNRENLISTLKKVRSDVQTLCAIDIPFSANRVRQNFDVLNDCRQYHSSAQKPILDTLFDVFDHVYHNAGPLTRQAINVGFVCGFIRQLPADIRTQKQILNRLALIPVDKYNRQSFEIIGKNLVDSYVSNGYKQDKDGSLGNKLYGLISIVADAQPDKRNCTQQNWLHDNLEKLSRVCPQLKEIADTTPTAKPRLHHAGRAMRDTLLESPVAFTCVKGINMTHSPRY